MGRAANWVRFVLGGEPAEMIDEKPLRAALTMGSSTGSLAPYTVAADLSRCGGGMSRDLAISVPAVKRARDLVVGITAAMPFTFWRTKPIGQDPQQLEPATWADRPDPTRTRQWIVAWTADDLMFEGRAYWRISRRTAAGFPASFELMRFRDVQVAANMQGLIWTDSSRPGVRVTVPSADVVEFLSPNDPLVVAGARSLGIAVDLDRSAQRHASHDVPSGWLEMDGEPPEWVADLDGLQQFLDMIAKAWHAARMANTTGALPEGIHYKESTSNPERMQLAESRQYAAVDAARLADVPGWFVGANVPGSSLTYQNAEQARADAIDFGAGAYIKCIEETLSGPNVTPLGNFVKLDPTDWLDVSTPALSTPTTEDVPA